MQQSVCVLLCYRQKQLDQSESRASAQRGELSAVKETHQQGEVERQLLEREKAQLSEALTRVRNSQYSWCLLIIYLNWVFLQPLLSTQAESSNAELSLLLNKLQSEDAALRDSLAKMGNMNEGLAQDKADLNTYILQVKGV